MPGSDLNAVVLQRIEVAPGLIVLRIAPEGWRLPEFESGQFAVIGLPGSAPRCHFSDPDDPDRDPDKLIRRAYSVASSSREREYLELFIALVGSGALTPRLFALQAGDRLWMGKKISGLFTLDSVPETSNVVLVATGTGLAPYMSMLRGKLLCEPGRRVAVLLGARHSWDLGYRSELSTMERLCPGFLYLPTVSRPGEELHPWSGHTGYVQELWTGGALAEQWGGEPGPADTHVLLCGSPAMIESMLTELGARGFTEHSRKEPGEIHVEKYW
jgi:ferredoxin/flavodoxin---NADP+ reductase